MDHSQYNFVEQGKILEEKRQARSRVDGLQVDGAGKCVHVGKILPGCKTCFITRITESICLGTRCNVGDCTYCFNDVHSRITEKDIIDRLGRIYRNSLDEEYRPKGFSFTNGEPLLYMDRLERFAGLINRIEQQKNLRTWNKLYTNGLLLDERKLGKLYEWNIRELRFHPSASGFSEEVYKNMEEASRMGFVVAVEEPAYPPNREDLLEALPVFEEIGVKHMQLCEPKVYKHNIDDIVEEFPEARFYFSSHSFLYHEGLTYEIMEKVVEKDYSYSVLDCSAELWRMSAVIDKEMLDVPDMDGVFARHDRRNE